MADKTYNEYFKLKADSLVGRSGFSSSASNTQKENFTDAVDAALKYAQDVAPDQTLDRDKAIEIVSKMAAVSPPAIASAGKMDIDAIQSIYGSPNLIRSAPSGTQVSQDDAFTYFLLMRVTQDVVKSGKEAKAEARKLLGTDAAATAFEKGIEADYGSLMSGMKADGDKSVAAMQLQESIRFNEKRLEQFIKDADLWAKAYDKATSSHVDDKKAIDEPIEAVATAFEAVVNRRDAWETAGGKAGDDEDKRIIAAFKKVEELYEAALTGDDDLKGAIRFKIHQKIDEKKTALGAAKLGKITDDDRGVLTKLAARDKDKTPGPENMLDSSLTQRSMGVAIGSGRNPTSLGTGDNKSKGKGNGTGVLVGAALLGAAAMAAPVLMKPKDQGVDEQGNPVPGKKWGFGKIFAVAAGAVVTTAAIMAMTRGKDAEGAMGKLKAGVSPLLGRG